VTRNQEHAVRTVIALLAGQEYEAVAAMTGERRLSASALRMAVSAYGRTIVVPPDGLPPDIGEYPDRSDPHVLRVVVDMWTAEEGRSDLSLELTLMENRLGLIDVEIDDFHVL
jgi:hypothetical protein